ncbi:MAG: hypothetical protein HC836_25145 [Richelia sp. RM2_1_2]|nr:hypothetical protein [Richelia sp. SM1_7_0]NJO61418.1 hypothetical protein [Richelia sp. RM2_1_2]
MMGLNNLCKRKPIVLIFMHLMQDLDIVLPIIEKLKKRDDLELKVCIIDNLLNKSPRISNALRNLGVKFSKVSRLGVLTNLEPSLIGVKAVITASESTANPHKAARALTQRANKARLATYTLQHGYENVGLNYFDEAYPAETIRFTSQKVLIWGSTDLLPPELLSETRSKCIAVGCPKNINSASIKVAIPGRRKHLIVIFENLHWERYNDEYRNNFLEDIEKTSLHFPDTTFLIKPHHAGVWLTEKYQGKLPSADNIIIADPQDSQWEAFTAPALIAVADGAITTPSTVALDAARSRCPVAVIGYNLDLPNYQPLSVLDRSADWITFVEQLQTTEGRFSAQKQAHDFIQRNIITGDAVDQILNLVTADISRKPQLVN